MQLYHYLSYFNYTENLDSLSKLTNSLQDKLQSSGMHAIPLDSEMLQLDCQATVRKGHEDSETGKLTMQRVQMNCSAMNKTMSSVKKVTQGKVLANEPALYNS